jgi:RNA polymerase sigma-70 factor (ECF subfamily)
MQWQTTQATLLRRLRDSDDHDAWAEFDRRYGDLILRYCRTRGLQLSDAEDVRQIVLMSLARSLPGFRYSRERGRFRGYLGRTVRNAIHRWSTRPNRAVEVLWLDGDDPPPAPAGETDDDAWEAEWTRHHLRTAMARIRGRHDAKSLEIFDRLLAGESPADVAAATGMTAAAVHKIKQRVRDRLREQVAAQLREEDTLD